MSTSLYGPNDGHEGANGSAEMLFYKALDLLPDQREAFLDEACGTDAALREEVESYLGYHERAGSFLSGEEPPLGETELQFGRVRREQAGDKIDQYTLLEQVGEGGFGTVWVAEQERPLRRHVALKIIKLGMDTADVVARFEQERQALAMMDHSSIAKVFDAGSTPLGRPFFVMELVRGESITSYCDQACLSTRDRLQLFIAVCQAVQHAHQKGIIHRDLKPSNILVSLHDGVPTPKVIDFGVAKATQQQRLTDLTILTRSEQLIGTPLYMAPEQADCGSMDVDTRSDIYSLGVLLYELLTGATPFDRDGLKNRGFDEVRRAIREEEPPTPSTLVSTMAKEKRTDVAKKRSSEAGRLIKNIKGDLDWIVMKALEKDRDRRYDTAIGLARDLERHLADEPVQARPPTWTYRFRRLVRRNKLSFAAGSAVLIALVGGLGISTWMFLQEKNARLRAVAAEDAQRHERQKAELAGKRSEQVSKLLTDMLKGVGPSVAKGRDTTMLREVLDKTAVRIGKDLKDYPDLEANLRSDIGGVYYDLGEYSRARVLYEQALDIFKRLYANDHQTVAGALYRLGTALHRQGKLPEAEAIFREALAIRRRLYGDESTGVNQCTSAIAGVLIDRGSFAAAETMIREALTTDRKLFGDTSVNAASLLETLAITLCHQDKNAAAEAVYRDALARVIKRSGKDDQRALQIRGNLAVALFAQDKISEAEKLNREVLAEKRKLFGSESYQTGSTLLNLSGCLIHQGELSEAESLLREALVALKKQLGNEHQDVAKVLNTTADLLEQKGKVTEAEAARREALAITRKTLGSEHPEVAASLWDVANNLRKQSELADFLRQQGKMAEAESMLREALSILKLRPDNESPDVVSLLTDFSKVLKDQGKLDESEEALREAIVLNRKINGEQDPDSAKWAKDLVEMLRSQNKYSEAEAVHRESLAAARKSGDDSPIELEAQLHDLAEDLYRQNKFAEAESLYREEIRSKEAHPKADNGAVVDTFSSLGRLLSEWAWFESHPQAGANPTESGPEIVESAPSRRSPFELAQEGERMLRAYVNFRSQVNHYQIATHRNRLGNAVLTLAITDPSQTKQSRATRLIEAESILLSSQKDLEQNWKGMGKDKRDSYVYAIRLYEVLGRADRVTEWQRKLEDYDKTFGSKKAPKVVTPVPE